MLRFMCDFVIGGVLCEFSDGVGLLSVVNLIVCVVDVLFGDWGMCVCE